MATRTLECSGSFLVDVYDSAEDEITIDNNDIEEINEILENQPPLIEILHDQINITSDLVNNTYRSNSTDNDVHSESSSFEVPSCSKCAEEMPFKSGHDVTIGTHIILGKCNIFRWINKAFDKMSFVPDKFKFKQKFVYFHHAIVSEVLETSDFTAKLKLVEFTSIGSVTFKVCETEVVIDIREKNVFYKKYKNPKYIPEKIVERARSRINAENYDLLANNCENVAVWCISGEHESFQSSTFVDNKVRQTFTWLGSLLGKITQYSLTNAADDILSFVKSIPLMTFSGIFFLIELIVSVLRFKELKYQYDRGLVCSACYNESKILLIAKIICSVTATAALAFIPCGNITIVSVSTTVLGIASVLILPKIIGFVYRGIKSFVNPLYTTAKMVVRKAKHIRAGDVLTITGDHDILINNIKLLERVEPNTFLSLNIVHFQFRGIWGTRTVTKERFDFKLKEDLLQVIDIPENEANPDEKVVEIAMEKANNEERGFNMFTYRSSHMSRRCKIRDYSTKQKIQYTVRDVQTASDVKKGDMVKFIYCTLPHQGIVVKKKSSGDLVEIEYYHVVDGTVQLETDRFDLGSCVVKKHIYSEEDCLDVKTTLERANETIGKRVHERRPYKSSRFVKSCKIAEKKDGNKQ